MQIKELFATVPSYSNQMPLLRRWIDGGHSKFFIDHFCDPGKAIGSV